MLPGLNSSSICSLLKSPIVQLLVSQPAYPTLFGRIKHDPFWCKFNGVKTELHFPPHKCLFREFPAFCSFYLSCAAFAVCFLDWLLFRPVKGHWRKMVISSLKWPSWSQHRFLRQDPNQGDGGNSTSSNLCLTECFQIDARVVLISLCGFQLTAHFSWICSWPEKRRKLTLNGLVWEFNDIVKSILVVNNTSYLKAAMSKKTHSTFY